MMNERREVLYQFAVEGDVPTEDRIAQYVAKYPQYEEDIRILAAELQAAHGEPERTEPLTDAELEDADKHVKELMFNFAVTLSKKRGIPPGHA
jgi:lipoate-protein ligase A